MRAGGGFLLIAVGLVALYIAVGPKYAVFERFITELFGGVAPGAVPPAAPGTEYGPATSDGTLEDRLFTSLRIPTLEELARTPPFVG